MLSMATVIVPWASESLAPSNKSAAPSKIHSHVVREQRIQSVPRRARVGGQMGGQNHLDPHRPAKQGQNLSITPPTSRLFNVHRGLMIDPDGVYHNNRHYPH